MEAGKLGELIDRVGVDCAALPNSVQVLTDHDSSDATATIKYATHTAQESDRIIDAWRAQNPTIQVERLHVLNPDHFESVAFAGENGRALRRVLARNVRELCARGVGSRGVLEYLEECRNIVTELEEFVQSTRAPV